MNITLNHINLLVSDVAKASVFFETHFGFKCMEVKGDDIVAVLKGVDGFTLVLMKNKKGIPIYPEAFHIGFMLGCVGEVNELCRRLKSAGIIDTHEPQKIRDSFGFYFNFDGIMIEVGHY